MITLVCPVIIQSWVFEITTDASLEVATLNPATMDTLQLFRGDSVIVRYVNRLGFSYTSADRFV
jgi:hypothetical protein